METVKKWLPLNFDLMSNPVNWAVIFLMITFAIFAVSVVFPKTTISTEE